MTTPRRKKKPPRPRRVRLDVDVRRAQLIELGKAAFAEQAYDAVSITELAASLGMSRALLYHYFPAKREFYIASLKAIAAELVALMTVELPEGAPIERVRASLDAYMDHIHARAASYVALMRSGTASDPEIAAVVEDVRGALIARLVAELHLASPTPLLRLGLRSWLAFVEAGVLVWLGGAEVDRAAMRELFVQALFATVQAAISR